MTNYSGSLNITGGIQASDGESATFSGTFGVSLTASLNSAGSGTATESVNGNLQVRYSYPGGGSNSVTLPFKLPTVTLPFQTGNFQVNEQIPNVVAGLQFGVSLNGSVSSDQSRISETIIGTANGNYQGISFNATFSSSGTLTAAPPPISPVSLSGTAGTQTISDTAAVAPFLNAVISDPNLGATATVRITLSNPANGTLSNLAGGSFAASTGIYTVSGTAAAVNAAVRGLVFTPTTHQAATGQTVTTNFTISLSDSVGQSATGAAANVVTTQTVLGALSVDQQLELTYLAYFNRAADGAGFSFWGGQNVAAQNGGQSAATALTNIANSFAPQVETIALYAFLSTPLVNLSTAAAQIGLGSFIGSVYRNLFGHAADLAGQSYWVSQVTGGAVGLGAAALAIANGATGSDAITLQNKIAVALDFTTRTNSAGLGKTVPVPASLLAAATSVLSGVDGTSLNDASVTTGKNATTSFISGTATGHQTAALSEAAPPADPTMIRAAGWDQVSPASGSQTIRFLTGGQGDTLALPAVDQISNFDPGPGVLDLPSLLATARVEVPGDAGSAGNDQMIADQSTGVLLRFGSAGHDSGDTIVMARGFGGAVTTSETPFAQGGGVRIT